jgi:SAM-dependent methyltransferase
VLDLACGQGAVSRALCQAGAAVTGVDLSPRLIQMARQRSPKAIRYLVGDARRLDSLPDKSFDAAVCVLAAQNIEPIAPVFAQCARLLKPGGRLVTVLTHPAFRIPRQSGWGRDEDRKLLFRRVDRYLTPLKIPIDMRPFKLPDQQVTWTYHRPIQTYVNGLAEAGLWTNTLEEWPSPRASQPGPTARAENRARGEFPLFLALRAVLVPEEWRGQRMEPNEPVQNTHDI